MAYEYVNATPLHYKKSDGTQENCYPVTGSGSCGDKSVEAKLNAGGYTFLAWRANDAPSSTGINFIKNGIQFRVPRSWYSRVCPSASREYNVNVTSKDAYGVENGWETVSYVKYSIYMDPAPPYNYTFNVKVSFSYYETGNFWGKGKGWNPVTKDYSITVPAGTHSASLNTETITSTGKNNPYIKDVSITLNGSGGYRWV